MVHFENFVILKQDSKLNAEQELVEVSRGAHIPHKQNNRGRFEHGLERQIHSH